MLDFGSSLYVVHEIHSIE